MKSVHDHTSVHPCVCMGVCVLNMCVCARVRLVMGLSAEVTASLCFSQLNSGRYEMI